MNRPGDQQVQALSAEAEWLLRETHHPRPHRLMLALSLCADDGLRWPCHTAQALATLDAERARSGRLKRALQWALEEGGWRLPYHAHSPIPDALEYDGGASPARIRAALDESEAGA
ncbi:MAG: hypothetical protein GEU71_03585 [Actinobacteria bacterium]|nr:hypothetical protein [Actinomycetota bacterium]